MSEPVKPEHVHYREYVRGLNGVIAICHVCKTSWPCLEAKSRAGAAAWWYINPQPPKVRRDPEA